MCWSLDNLALLLRFATASGKGMNSGFETLRHGTLARELLGFLYFLNMFFFCFPHGCFWVLQTALVSVFGSSKNPVP